MTKKTHDCIDCNPKKCPYCGKMFEYSSQLKLHVNDHLWSKQTE
jgi:uncharacterized C2H2 Zn-finger protein